MRKYLSIIPIILVSLYPVVGVFFLDWSIFSVVFFYWLETITFGLAILLSSLFWSEFGKGVCSYFEALENTQKSIFKQKVSSVRVPLIWNVLFAWGGFILVMVFFIFKLFEPSDFLLRDYFLPGISLLIGAIISITSQFDNNGLSSVKEIIINLYKRLSVIFCYILIVAFLNQKVHFPLRYTVLILVISKIFFEYFVSEKFLKTPI